MRETASLKTSLTDTIVNLSKSFSFGICIVSVMIIFFISDLFKLFTELPDRTPCVATTVTDFAPF